MEDVIKQRKEKVISFLKNYKNYLVYVALTFVIWLGAFIRTRNLELLKDVTTGKYLTSELDSTLFLRYAQYIVEHGSLFAVDPMRFYPVGADLQGVGTFVSYFVAYLYKFIHFFGSNLTLEYVDIIYPVIATIVLSIFLFLLMKKLFDWRVGLLSVVFINFLPSFIFRSTGGSTDHDALVAMFIVMALYFFVCSMKSENIGKAIGFAFIAGILTTVARETAGSGSFLLFIIGAFTIVKILFDKFSKKDFYCYLAWIIPFTIYWGLFSRLGLKTFFVSLNNNIAYLALALAIVYYLLFEIKIFKAVEKFSEKIPKGLLSLIITFIVGAIFVYFIFGGEFFTRLFSDLYIKLFHSYENTRWTLTVAENKKAFVTDWIGQMGKIYVYLFIFGSIALFHKVVRKIKAAKWYTWIYALFIFGYVFSRYSSSSILNGDSGLSQLLFYGSIFLFFGALIYGYLRTFYKDKHGFKEIETHLDLEYGIIFVWFFIKILAATSAIRLLFEFSLVTAPLAAFFVIWLYDYFLTLNNKPLKYALVFVLVFLLLSPFAFSKGVIPMHYQSSANQAQYIGPSYNQQWQFAGRWARENTPKDAVFAHWWDYGYWVQSGFERASVTDGGNFFVYWNYLSGRYLLTGQNSTEALEFMKAHNATYFLTLADDIGKYGAYASIGSDVNYDRFSTVGIFNLDPKQVQETKNETLFVYTGGIMLDENYKYKNDLLPAGGSAIMGFILRLGNVTNDGNQFTGQFRRVDAAVNVQGKQLFVPIKCLQFQGTEYTFEEDEEAMPGCLRIIPGFMSQTQVEPLAAAIFVSPRVYRTVFGQMYLLDRELPGFKLVYSDHESMPLAIYQGRLIGPLKIWQADTSNVKFKPEYLELEYPDLNLTLVR